MVKKAVKKTVKAAPKATKKVSNKAAKKVVGKSIAKKAVKKAPKKAAKKTVKRSNKKAVKKGKATVTITTQVLGEAPREHHFVLNDGRVLKSVQELADSLEDMATEVFDHHVNPMRNDFATWVEDVFEERSLARDLRETRNRIETRIKLLQRLVDEVLRQK